MSQILRRGGLWAQVVLINKPNVQLCHSICALIDTGIFKNLSQFLSYCQKYHRSRRQNLGELWPRNPCGRVACVHDRTETRRLHFSPSCLVIPSRRALILFATHSIINWNCIWSSNSSNFALAVLRSPVKTNIVWVSLLVNHSEIDCINNAPSESESSKSHFAQLSPSDLIGTYLCFVIRVRLPYYLSWTSCNKVG